MPSLRHFHRHIVLQGKRLNQIWRLPVGIDPSFLVSIWGNLVENFLCHRDKYIYKGLRAKKYFLLSTCPKSVTKRLTPNELQNFVMLAGQNLMIKLGYVGMPKCIPFITKFHFSIDQYLFIYSIIYLLPDTTRCFNNMTFYYI